MRGAGRRTSAARRRARGGVRREPRGADRRAGGVRPGRRRVGRAVAESRGNADARAGERQGTGGGERIETVRVRGDRAGDGAGGRGTRGGGEF